MPAKIIYEDDNCLAFDDIHPQAPVHFLVIPKTHIDSFLAADQDTTGTLFQVAANLARQKGIDSDGFRTVINCGQYGGQTVHHLHVHVMGGRRFAWPPG